MLIIEKLINQYVARDVVEVAKAENSLMFSGIYHQALAIFPSQ